MDTILYPLFWLGFFIVIAGLHYIWRKHSSCSAAAV